MGQKVSMNMEHIDIDTDIERNDDHHLGVDMNASMILAPSPKYGQLKQINSGKILMITITIIKLLFYAFIRLLLCSLYYFFSFLCDFFIIYISLICILIICYYSFATFLKQFAFYLLCPFFILQLTGIHIAGYIEIMLSFFSFFLLQIVFAIFFVCHIQYISHWSLV